MLGDDYLTDDNWPGCGEIDVMEYWGYDPKVTAGTTHDPGGDTTYHENGLSGNYQLPGQVEFWRDYHVFAIEWEPEVVRFYVDGLPYHCVLSQTATGNLCDSAAPMRMPSYGQWVFNHPFFLLLNLAIDSSPNAQANPGTFPKKMYVDYVRVYQKQ